jgi:hypothetical protein
LVSISSTPASPSVLTVKVWSHLIDQVGAAEVRGVRLIRTVEFAE